MGKDGTITVTCDCGRNISARRDLAGQQLKCPVCGAVVLIPVEEIDQSGPPCPNCGRPWPATEMRCPSCLMRNRRKKKSSEDTSSPLSNRFGPEPSDLDDLGDSGLDMDDLASVESTSPKPDTRIKLPGLGKIWISPAAQAWYLATGIVLLCGVVAMLVGATGGGWVWLLAGAVYLLAGAGMYRGFTVARSVVFLATLFGGLILIALAIMLSPGTVKIGGVVMTMLSLAASLAGFRILTGKASNRQALITGGTFLGAGLLVLIISAGTSGLTLRGKDGLAASLKNTGDLMGNILKPEALAPHFRANTAPNNEETEASEPVSETTAETQANADNDSGPEDDPLDSRPIAVSIYREDLDKDAAPTVSPVKSADLSTAPPRDQWLDMLNSHGASPELPPNWQFHDRELQLELSPLHGKVKMDSFFCTHGGSELFLMCSSPWLQEQIDTTSEVEELLRWAAYSTAKTYNLTVADHVIRTSPQMMLMARLEPNQGPGPLTGRLQVLIIDKQLVVFGGVHKRSNATDRIIINNFISSMKFNREEQAQSQP